MFLDTIHYNVRDNGVIVKKAVYIVLAYNREGLKEVLGMWVGENESSKYWLMVLNELKTRGLEDILIISTDNLPWFTQAIEAVFPKTVYKAASEDLALTSLDYFEEKWGDKYPSCISSWRRNWAELSTYFKYPQEIRTLIYTTNSIEAFNRQLRKVTKNKTIFPNDFSLVKSLYLAMADASLKWTSRMKSWDKIISQLRIFFEDRI